MNRSFTKYYCLFIIFIAMGEVFCESLNVGEKAPSISLIRLENKEYFKSLELIGEKNLVLCFFSSWDKSFINTLPELIEISNDFHEHSEFILVSVREKKPLIKDFVSKKNISLQVAMDKFGKTFKKFGGNKTPLIIVINKRGFITYKLETFNAGYEIELVEHLKLKLD